MLHDAIIELYLQVKVRSNDEVRKDFLTGFRLTRSNLIN